MIQSDSTVVPPVTAERSPPASRTTGADSPVMADSSTEAAPSMTSLSLNLLAGAYDHQVAARELGAGNDGEVLLVLNGLDAMGLDILLGRTQESA